jgi:DNA-binding IscR family transcriptional regulator
MPHLLGTVQVSADRLEAMLDTMVSAAWVSRAAPAGWVLNRDAAAIQVTDVYRLFVLDTSARVPSRDADAELERMLQEMSARAAEHMAISIEQLFSVSDHNAGERTGATDGTG